MRNENQMSTTPRIEVHSNPRGVGLSVAAGLVAFYFLSPGPTGYLLEKYDPSCESPICSALWTIYSPIGFLYNNTPADQVIDWYLDLWGSDLW